VWLSWRSRVGLGRGGVKGDGKSLESIYTSFTGQ